MKNLALVGVLLLVLGLLSFVIPIPHRENHGLTIGDTKIGVQTQSSEKLPPAVGIVLLAGGVIALVLGSRKTLAQPFRLLPRLNETVLWHACEIQSFNRGSA